VGPKQERAVKIALAGRDVSSCDYHLDPPLRGDNQMADGRLTGSAPTNAHRLGDKIRLIPGHCDPTVNLLVCLCARQSRRAGLDNHRPRRRVLTLIQCQSRF
jgi:hypothetical protein